EEEEEELQLEGEQDTTDLSVGTKPVATDKLASLREAVFKVLFEITAEKLEQVASAAGLRSVEVLKSEVGEGDASALWKIRNAIAQVQAGKASQAPQMSQTGPATMAQATPTVQQEGRKVTRKACYGCGKAHWYSQCLYYINQWKCTECKEPGHKN